MWNLLIYNRNNMLVLPWREVCQSANVTWQWNVWRHAKKDILSIWAILATTDALSVPVYNPLLVSITRIVFPYPVICDFLWKERNCFIGSKLCHLEYTLLPDFPWVQDNKREITAVLRERESAGFRGHSANSLIHSAPWCTPPRGTHFFFLNISCSEFFVGV